MIEDDFFDEGPVTNEAVTEAKQVLYGNPQLQRWAIILFRKIKFLEEQLANLKKSNSQQSGDENKEG